MKIAPKTVKLDILDRSTIKLALTEFVAKQERRIPKLQTGDKRIDAEMDQARAQDLLLSDFFSDLIDRAGR